MPVAIPESVAKLLAAKDAQKGFPAGTMQAVMQQEVGPQAGKFLADPTAYHYEANDKGQRVAKHTGKVSTAFGPFGILESTARDPGYGVKPLADKTSFSAQLDFAADYLGARAKQGGSLVKGLAGYGEGSQYGAQVVAKIPGAATAASSPVVLPPARAAGAPYAAVVPVADPQPAPVQVAFQAPAPVEEHIPVDASIQAPVQVAEASQGRDAWQAFLQSMPEAGAPAEVTSFRSYGRSVNLGPRASAQSRRPNFSSFASWLRPGKVT